jgi:predicted secreted protein
MGATQGTIGKGTLLKIGNGVSPETFTAIAEVKDITGPALSVEFADFTHQESPSGYREFKSTFKDSGNMTFAVNFLPDNTTQGFSSAGLLKDYEAGTLRNFQLLFPDTGATLASFAAYVANLQPSAPLNGPLAMNVTLRITGPVTWS